MPRHRPNAEDAITVTKIVWAMVQNQALSPGEEFKNEFGMMLKIGTKDTPESAMEMGVDHESTATLFFNEHQLAGLLSAIPQVLAQIEIERPANN